MSSLTEAVRKGTRGPVPVSPAERFWNAVMPEPMSGCWLWDGAYNNKGYGRLSVGSIADGSAGFAMAHRISFELHFGPIPESLELDHLCRNPSCVNPQHLEPVTHAENMKRGLLGNKETNVGARLNREKTHCTRGHPYEGENLYQYGSHRHCKECGRVRYARDAKKLSERTHARKAADPEYAERRRQYQTEWARRARNKTQGHQS